MAMNSMYPDGWFQLGDAAFKVIVCCPLWLLFIHFSSVRFALIRTISLSRKKRYNFSM